VVLGILLNRQFSIHPMCLAVPGKVLDIDGTTARVDFGHGAVREVDLSLVDVTVGKYVLVHTGYAIKVMEEDEAKASLDLWEEILGSLKE
jgi:hydrogenase expression/formation protein HypC